MTTTVDIRRQKVKKMCNSINLFNRRDFSNSVSEFLVGLLCKKLSGVPKWCCT